jgi:hypothetical protein
MNDENTREIRIEKVTAEKYRGCPADRATIVGPIWYIGWLFTVAFVHLPFWKAVLALIIWPYYLGSTLR